MNKFLAIASLVATTNAGYAKKGGTCYTGDDCITGHYCLQVKYYGKDQGSCVEAADCGVKKKGVKWGSYESLSDTCHPLNWAIKRPAAVEKQRCYTGDGCVQSPKKQWCLLFQKAGTKVKESWCINQNPYPKGQKIEMSDKVQWEIYDDRANLIQDAKWVDKPSRGHACAKKGACNDKLDECQAVTTADGKTTLGMCVEKAVCEKAKKGGDAGKDFGGKRSYKAAADGCGDPAAKPPAKDDGGSKPPAKAKSGAVCTSGKGCESAGDSCAAATADGGKTVKNLCVATATYCGAKAKKGAALPKAADGVDKYTMAEAACKKADWKASAMGVNVALSATDKFDVSKFVPKKSAAGLECSMDGYVKLVRQALEVGLLLLSLMKEGLAFLLPATLKKAVKYAWAGVVGLGNWMGYALAAVYYLGLEFGFGDIVCNVFGYVNVAVATMHTIVDFATPLAAQMGALAGGAKKDDKKADDGKKKEEPAKK